MVSRVFYAFKLFFFFLLRLPPGVEPSMEFGWFKYRGHFETVFKRIVQDELKQEPSESQFIFTKQAFNDAVDMPAAIVQTLMEEYNIQGIMWANENSAAMLTTGKLLGLLINLGHTFTLASAICTYCVQLAK